MVIELSFHERETQTKKNSIILILIINITYAIIKRPILKFLKFGLIIKHIIDGNENDNINKTENIIKI